MPHGFKKHLKRVSAPSSWMLDKMSGVFAPRPSSGPHKLRESIPLVLVLRNKLKLALDGTEAYKICARKHVLVDKKIRTDFKFPAGFMDVVEIPQANVSLRVMYDEKGRFNLLKIGKEEASYKLCKVTSKKLGEKKVPLIGTHDGRTFRYADPAIKVGDSIKLDLNTGKITEHFKLDNGALCFVYKGRNTGRMGVLVNRERHLGSFDIATLKDASGATFAVRLNAVFVIGHNEKKPGVETLPKAKGVKISIIEEAAKRYKKQAEAA